MREVRCSHVKWLLVVFCVSINSCNSEGETQTWSKPEKSISSQNNDWIPVQGKCLTCRPNRDLEAQSTNEQINRVLSPPLPDSPSLPPPQVQQIQYLTNKQPRILPSGINFAQYNSPFLNNNKPYQAQPTKLFQQEPQKQYFQYENPSFVKQPFNLAPQQLIQQSPPLVQQSQQQSQRFPLSEPYSFTLPLKTVDATTPRITYQPKIRFPDSIPNNKITAQNNEEIQLLYVPVETLQRGRKNMKELLNQNQYPPTVPHGFVSPQYNLQYTPIPKAPENQFFFPPSFPQAGNFLQLNPLPQQNIPETVYANISKNFLQPYFTINGLYTTIPQVQPLPTRQPELQFYNIMQPGVINPNQFKVPEQQFKTPEQQFKGPPGPPRQSNKFEYNNLRPQGGFVFPNPNEVQNVQNQVSTLADVYTPTTPEVTKSTQFVTEKSTYQNLVPENQYKDFEYQYVTTSPQTSASQNQQYISDNRAAVPPKQIQQTEFNQKSVSQRPLQTNIPSRPAYDDVSNYPVPHQPPLSFYMEKLHNSKINDVLYLLKDAKTIPVLDTVETEPPQVFVGPSELQPPKGYIKFELPYLSSLDYNRIERMIDKLPFFVAPLNFKPPSGYSKIPFPAPHIGSVVLSNSTTIQESLHDKSYEQKYRPSTHSFSLSPELSTITPQLTSQINSLSDIPSSPLADPISFKNFIPVFPKTGVEHVTYKQYPVPTDENITKIPNFKYTSKTNPTTESPKRVTNRQRKPIYRGYPSSTTPSTTTQSLTTATSEFTSTTESVQRLQSEPTRDAENYVEFAAKGKFNINNGNEKVLPSNPTVDNTFQSPVTSSTYQPPTEFNKNNFDFSNYFSNFGGQDSSFQGQKQTSTQSGEYYSGNNQNYPYYSSQTPNDVKSEATFNQINKTEPDVVTDTNVNFSNVKPLSQYNPFSKNEDSTVNFTEPASVSSTSQQSQQDLNNFQFWNENQFYNANPSTIDYFSSTAGSQSQETPSTTEASNQKISTPTYAPEPSYSSTDIHKIDETNDYSSTESTERTSTNSYRPRTKQRVHGNRYHQSRYTTEKDNDYPYHKSGFDKIHSRTSVNPENTYESSTQSDMISQSTENQEFSTKNNIKSNRRRNRPVSTSTSPVTEISSSTSRSFRTRATRYPSASSTEKYRVRRPTTNAASTSDSLNGEWGSYANNFAPSAPATNDITIPIDNRPRTNTIDDNNNYHKSQEVNHFWIDSGSAQQSHSFEANPTTQPVAKTILEESYTQAPHWADLPKSNAATNEYSQFTPTAQGEQFSVEQPVENKTENIDDRKDESNQFELKNTVNSVSRSSGFEEINATSAPDSHKENVNGDSNVQNEKNFDAEVTKEKFLSKDSVDGQKKAYDPQDEKKSPVGRRRGTWVRRIRIKRPQDVLETAESQNLGRITDNSLQATDSKIFSKSEEKEDGIPKVTPTSSSTLNDFVTSTEVITEKEEIKTTTSQEDYANLQNNFAQMLSDFLNSNEKSAKPVNNIERYNTTENSISFILGLNSNEKIETANDSSSSNSLFTRSATENVVTNVDDLITVTNNYPASSNTEFSEHPTTTEESPETIGPNKLIATSTTTEISLETEICYRGRCVKTKKSKASDLLPVE